MLPSCVSSVYSLEKDEGEVTNVTPKDEITPGLAIDMGLSVKWASCNIGASSPEQYGGYYAWGETEMKKDYDWPTYKWCNNSTDYPFTKYCNNSNYGYNGLVDNKTQLDASDDVAHIKWGSSWRMPTSDEMDELLSTERSPFYDWKWKSLNGHNGWMITYLVNNNSIFLPAAGDWYGINLINVGSKGFYGSSSLYTRNPNCSCSMAFSSDYVSSSCGSSDRSIGLTVRPVTE